MEKTLTVKILIVGGKCHHPLPDYRRNKQIFTSISTFFISLECHLEVTVSDIVEVRIGQYLIIRKKR